MTGKPAGARPNREGKPWKRKDGRWVIRVWPPKGSIDRSPRYVYGRTAAEVKQKKRDLEAELAKGMPEDKDQTVGDYLERWLDVTLAQYLAAGQLAQSTADSYRDNARLHILPGLSHVRLRELTAPMVREWQTRLSKKPSGRPRRKLRKGETELPAPPTLSARTVAYCHAILHKALEDAIRDGVAGLERNAVGIVAPPKDRNKMEIAPPTATEASALLVAMSADRFWCYWLTAFVVGFRRGEGLGMRWCDLDLAEKVWRPGASIQRMRSGKLVPKELKTRASRKPVPLPNAAVEALARWNREQRKTRLAAPFWADLDLVFTTGIGRPIEPRNINRQWLKVCAAAGVRTVRLHDLRHACASYMLAKGVDLKTVQGTLRHSQLSTTALYLHALEEIPRAGADAMDEVVTDLRRKAGL